MDAAERGRAVMLGLMVGDALGAAVEGWDPKEVRALAEERCGGPLIGEYIEAIHMGTFVVDPAGPETPLPVPPRPADRVNDSRFLPTGPPKEAWRGCARRGMYTDDTNTCLALASSLLECGGVDGAHAARTFADWWRSEPLRGYPPSAKQVMQLVLDGVPHTETGRPPHFPFSGGSFANGGAMRIAPLAVAYRGASAAELRRLVQTAIESSHTHPEAVDGAVVQAAAVQAALRGAALDAAWVRDLAGRCETQAMQQALEAVAASLRQDAAEDHQVLAGILKWLPRTGSGLGFQIAAVHMMPCVIWIAARYAESPAEAVQRAIALGGDTDTCASMVGAIMGARHGCSWVPPAWFDDLEAGPRGRDFAMELGAKLAAAEMCGAA